MTQNTFPRWLIVIVVTVMIVLLIGGVWFYRVQQHELQQQAEDELQTVAQLKVDQIVAWRAERLGDAALLTESPLFVEGVVHWLTDPQSADTQALLAQFQALKAHYNYYNVELVDVDGNVQLSLDGEEGGPLHAEARKTLAAALQSHQPMLTGLHLTPGDLTSHIDVIAPLFVNTDASAEPIGAIILQSDASQFLYPLIQSWPTPSSSAETLLVRREGDSVLFLNELRHQKGTALTLHVPLTQIDLPAAKAVQGYVGITQGKDYRGVEVVAAVQAVPDSPWFIVAKMDRSEIFADWQLYSWLILGMILGALVTVGATGGAVWQRNQRAHYQTLFQVEKAHQESEARYQTTLLSIGDGVIVTGTDERVILLNPVAETLTGWSQADANGKPLEEIFHIVNEETRQAIDNPVRRVVREGIVVGLANHTLLITRDGQELPIADSGAPIHDENGQITGVVLVFRDQSEERAAQKALEGSEAYVRTILDNLPVGVAVNSVLPEVTFSYMNDNFVKCYRTTREALDEPDSFWAAAYQDTEFREVIRSRILEDVVSGDPARMYWEDVPITRKGEETTFLSARNTPINGTELMLSTVWDTTERKRAEEALRKLSHAIEFSPSVVYITDHDGKIEYVNPKFAQVTGYTVEEAIGHLPRILDPRKISPEEHEGRWRTIRTGKEWRGEFRNKKKNGEPFWESASISSIKDETGALAHLILVMEDITERKQAEEALRESERFAYSTLNGLSAHIAIVDETGTVLAVNSNWRAFAETNGGCVADVCEGANYLAVCEQASGPQSEGAQEFAAAIRAVLNGEYDHFELEYPCHSPSEQRWFLGRITPFPGEGPARVVITHENVTRSKLAELQLAEERNLLRTLIDNLPDFIYAKDTEGRFILKNQADAHHMGASSTEETIGKTDFDYFSLEVAQQYYLNDQAVIQSGQPLLNREEPFLSADGTQSGWLLTTKVPLRDEAGRVIGLVGIGRDITARKQAEQQLRELNETLEQRVIERTEQLNHTKERIEAILNSSSDIIVLCRPDGRIDQVNPAFDEAFHCQPDEVYNRLLTWLAAPEYEDVLQQAFARAVKDRQAQRLEMVVSNQQSVFFEADAVLSPIMQSNSQMWGVICSLRDITERKEMEAQLRQMLEREMELGELKSRYVSMAAHDLRNPLAVIQGTISLVRQYGDRLSGDKLHEKYDRIESSITVMVEMLDDILTLGKVESGRLRFEPIQLDVIPFCENLVAEMQQAAITITQPINFSSQADCRIAMLDVKLLRHILINLLSNALKYSPEDRPVTFTVECEPDQIIFHIQDQGIGIPKDDQKRLFETFHRANNARHLPGTGLGLAIVKQSVDLHGGTITFESEEGHGTTFTVVVPQTPSEKNPGH